MIRIKNVVLVLSLVASLSLAAVAVTPFTETYFVGDKALWLFNNIAGEAAQILHLEFEQEVTISGIHAVGGGLVPTGPLTGTVFDFAGILVNQATFLIYVEPATAVPALAQWLKMDDVGNTVPIGSPFFTSLTVLGRLFGIGIVALREANPVALGAAFEQFFTDNAAYLAGLSESLGMSLADSLMPIIMASPADGITNFFNTIMGMLGLTELSAVVTGDVDWSALFVALGM